MASPTEYRYFLTVFSWQVSETFALEVTSKGDSKGEIMSLRKYWYSKRWPFESLVYSSFRRTIKTSSFRYGQWGKSLVVNDVTQFQTWCNWYEELLKFTCKWGLI